MSKHTPGPWTVHKHSLGIIGEAHINGPHHCAIAYVGFGTQTLDHYVTGEEAEANALLIAAAPELLAELKDLVRRFEKCMLAHGNSREIAAANVGKARAAIAKATGEE